jgi:hypothetical protein
MSCFIEGRLVAAEFDPSSQHSSLPTGPPGGPGYPASIPLLVTVVFGDQQFSCLHSLRFGNVSHVVLGLDWFALFQEYYLSTDLHVYLAQPFVFDGESVFWVPVPGHSLIFNRFTWCLAWHQSSTFVEDC